MTAASTPLARIIESVKEANRWSDYDIENRARAGEYRLSKSSIAEMRTKSTFTIVPDKIRALAYALGLPVGEVLRAALETVNLPTASPSIAPEQAIQSDPTLSAISKRQLLVMLREMRREDEDVRMFVNSPSMRRARAEIGDEGLPEEDEIGAAELGIPEPAHDQNELHTRRSRRLSDRSATSLRELESAAKRDAHEPGVDTNMESP